MLTKRTNILFEEEMWAKLLTLSKFKKVSVGDLVRNAVIGTYFDNKEQFDRAEAIDKIMAIRKTFKGKIDYKKLINAGRKY